MPKPLIGITAYKRVISGTGWRYDASYERNAAAIEEVGGLPVLIPDSLQEENLRAIYDRLDAVFLPGGEDVDPTQYRADPHPKLGKVNPTRDQMELSLARWAVQDDRPLLGVCRGIQVINVAMGGTLVQDIPSLVGEELRHDIFKDSEPRNLHLHDITVEEKSRLAQILGTRRLPVNSLHHQSLEALADGFVITARADDGVIEAIEMPDKRFVLAVQWHPEDLSSDDDSMQALFKAFVDAAKAHMS